MPFAFSADEDEAFAQLEAARKRQQQYQQAANVDTARQVAALTAAYPMFKGGDALALAKGGYTPDSPLAAQVARLRTVKQARSTFGLHLVGDVISGAAALAKSGVDAAFPYVKGGVRLGLTALAAPYEEAQGVVRNIADISGGLAGLTSGAAIGAAVGSAPLPLVGTVLGAGAGALVGGIAGGITGQLADPKIKGRQRGFFEGTGSQSQFGVALGQLVKGDKVRLGSGWLPGGEVRKEQTRRAQEVSIAGHALTPGRLVAAGVTEPGTTQYNLLSGLVDFTAAVKADPASLALAKAGKVAQARKLFTPEQAGLINGLRKTTAADRVTEWLDNPRTGGRVLQGLADDTSAYSIWRRTNKKIDVEDARQLAQLNDPTAVRVYLEPKLGVTIREKPTLAALPNPNPVVRRIRDARVWQDVPGKFIDFDNPNGAAKTVDDFLRNAGIRDETILAKHFDNITSALSPGAQGGLRYQAVTETAKAVEDALKGNGATTSVARQATTLFKNRFESLRAYNIDSVGNDEWFPGVKVNGRNDPVASPHLLVEALASKVPLPNAQDIRRATSVFTPLFEAPILGKGIKGTELVLSTLSDTLWKPLVLLRGAWTARVIGEEQIRIAASGFDSFANHPLAALALSINDNGKLGRTLGKAGFKGRAQVDVFGDLFRDRAKLAPNPTEFEQAQYQGRIADPAGRARKVGLRGKIAYDRDLEPAQYVRAWADELLQLRSDPIGLRAANGGLIAGDRTPNPLPGIDGIKDWFWQGAGRKLREDLSEQLHGPDPLSTRAAADDYIDSVVTRLETKTGGDPTLTQAVVTGELNGINIRAGDKLNPKFLDELDTLRGVGPQKAKGDVTLSMRDGQLREIYDNAINRAFEFLMVRPSNKLSRSPTFRQAYWQRLRELVPFADDATQQAIIQAAGNANLSKETVAAFRRAAEPGPGTAITQLDQADMVAKAYGLHTTRDLLYDISQRGQLSDQLRLILPFAEAWKEVLTRWGKIAVQNPKVIRRGQQIVEGARGAGFFHPDPATGEEVFAYPGTGFITENLLGVRAPFTGRVSGLSLAASVIPGVGPVVQYPASKLLPNTPQWDAIREIVLPFGDPRTEGGTVESFLPAWVQRFRTAFFRNDPEHDRQFGNTVFDVARYLVSTGDYNTNSPEEVDRLMTDATSKAKNLFVLRGLAQFVAPSPPTPELLVKDKDGRFQVQQTLAEHYRALQQKPGTKTKVGKIGNNIVEGVGFENATQTFLDTFGEGALLVLQPKTTGAGPATSQVAEFARSNPDIVRQYRDVYTFFAPQGGEFDIDFYNQQLNRGERKPLTPDTAVKFANHRVAQLIYHQARDRVGERADDDARRWLANIRDQLIVAYPGYNPEGVTVDDTAATIVQIREAVKNPRLADTPAGQAISLYLAARDRALQAAQARGLSSFAQAKSATDLREWLRNIAEGLQQAIPDFSLAYDQLFSREMRDDSPEPAEQVA